MDSLLTGAPHLALQHFAHKGPEDNQSEFHLDNHCGFTRMYVGIVSLKDVKHTDTQAQVDDNLYIRLRKQRGTQSHTLLQYFLFKAMLMVWIKSY